MLVAAVRSARGASYKLLQLLHAGDFDIAISNSLYFEYVDVLLRPEIKPIAMSDTEMIAAIDEIVRSGVYQEVYFRWRPWLSDPDDDMILELAIAAKCDFIVTFNLKDFRRSEAFGIEVLSPTDFLEFLRGR